MVYPNTRSQTAQQQSQEPYFFSLTINRTPNTIDVLDGIYEGFEDEFEEDGNEYLYPIQQARRARHDIGHGYLLYALLILIKSIIKYGEDSVFSHASQATLQLPRDHWVIETTLAQEIIKKFRNTETIEDLINDDGRLSTEIHYAAENYGITPQIVG
mgnify:CR=1 FL=1|tara:strand:+ start:66 stop:536 length:471 start_codon:yes stop_codon:yes gene_type:complete